MRCGSKMITNYSVTDAALYDSNRCGVLLDEADEILYAAGSSIYLDL